MAIDREASLKRAEKLLRQGRLDGAIGEYAHILEEQPTDWNTRNSLGDLYVRAGQPDHAVAQFAAIADHFATEGFLPRAIALYKKVLKIKPDDEHALLQAADINTRLGLLAEAKSCLGAVAEQRRRRGDKAGSNEVLVRISNLDPGDLGARMSAARASAELGDVLVAADLYKQIASELFARDQPNEAIDALAEAVHLDASDMVARDSLVAAFLNRGQLEEARSYAATAGHLKALADTLVAGGREDEAIDALFEAVQHDPTDIGTRATLVRSLFDRGDFERASACLQPDTLGAEPELLLLAAELNLRTGRPDAARDLLRSLVNDDAGRRSEVLRLGYDLAPADPDGAFQCVDVATDAAVLVSDWVGAATGLREFARIVPGHVATLIRLVDVCVDGDLEGPLALAQAELAELYLAAGRAFEARVIAEDLATRMPGDAAHLDRFRRALVMLGEKNPDAIIADRLSQDASGGVEDFNEEMPPPASEAAPAKVLPFARNVEPDAGHVEAGAGGRGAIEVTGGGWSATSTSPLPAPEEHVAFVPREAAGAAASRTPAAQAGIEQKDSRPAQKSSDQRGQSSVYDLGAIDSAPETPQAAGGAAHDFEIDLNGALGDLKPIAAPFKAGPAAPPTAPVTPTAATPAASATPAAAPQAASAGRDIESVFEEFREDVLREQASNTAAQHYKLALTYHDMGMVAECVKALEVAARSPKYRFQSAALLGRIHAHEGRTQEAIDWLERAAETPAPSADAGRALLYELGQTLEDAGEAVRALAVYLELQADAGDYRDVAVRIKRLSR